jgi:hypothetical protein
MTALILFPAVSAAVLALLAIGLVVNDARAADPLHGRTLVAVWMLAALIALVPVVAFFAARTAVPDAGYPAPEQPQSAAARHAVSPTAQGFSRDGQNFSSAGQFAGPPAERSEPASAGAAMANPALTPAPASAPTSWQVRDAPAQDLTVGTAGEDVFVHLSRRLQSLVHRQIELLDTLENEVEDPDLLKGLFGVDHLATRMRRHAENLAVLGGAMARRQWTRPVSVMELLRSAVSETLEYARVQVVPRAPGHVNGYAVADVIHLLAELVENATSYSPPDSKVVLRVYPVTAGLAIEIDDRGLGMRPEDYHRLNALLREPVGISVQELLQGGRIGLYVVAQLARRHGVAVQLQPNITGGIQALVVLPQTLLAQVETRPIEPAPQVLRALEPRVVDQRVVDQRFVDQRISENHNANAQERPAVPPLPAPASAALIGGDSSGSGSGSGSGYSFPAADAATRASASAGTGASAGPGGDTRPPLPTREPQRHLAAMLIEAPAAPADRVGAEPTPTMMASFRRGLEQGAAAPWPTSAQMEQSQAEPSHAAPSYVEQSQAEPSHAAPSYAEAAPYAEPSRLKPAYHVEPSYTEPPYVEPSYVEPSYVEPSYAENSYAESPDAVPSYGEHPYPRPSYPETVHPQENEL